MGVASEAWSSEDEGRERSVIVGRRRGFEEKKGSEDVEKQEPKPDLL